VYTGTIETGTTAKAVYRSLVFRKPEVAEGDERPLREQLREGNIDKIGRITIQVSTVAPPRATLPWSQSVAPQVRDAVPLEDVDTTEYESYVVSEDAFHATVAGRNAKVGACLPLSRSARISPWHSSHTHNTQKTAAFGKYGGGVGLEFARPSD
jgi:hypothetical protein